MEPIIASGAAAAPATDAVPPRRIVAARTGVAVVFALNGAAAASWFARVPAAKATLGLTAGQLGLLLLALSVGAVAAMPAAGVLVHRLGTRRSVASATVTSTVGLALVGVATGWWASVPLAAVGLFALGFGSGICDVAMNVEGAAVERRLGRTVMPRFHAAWSLGTVAAAGIGAGTAQLKLPVVVHLLLVAVLVLGGTLTAVRWFLAPRPDHDGGDGTRRDSGVLAAWREPRTLLVGLLVLVMAFAEGTANDWLAVAFVDGYAVSQAGGAVAYGVFVAAMTVGRTAGTLALDRWGRVPVLAGSILVAAAGTVIAVVVGSSVVAMGGVVLWGLGTSLGFPVGMSAAADDEARASARVSVVAVIGYTAFLAGPPLLGFLGDKVGTLHALLAVSVLLLPALALVPATRPLPSRPTQ